jgi:hypothetical protein
MIHSCSQDGSEARLVLSTLDLKVTKWTKIKSKTKSTKMMWSISDSGRAANGNFSDKS